MLTSHTLQVSAELLTNGIPTLGLFAGDLIEVIGCIVREIIHVLSLLLH